MKRRRKVTFLPLRASARFPALQLGSIALLGRNTTWTFDREASLRVHFAGIILYDGQGFMVPTAASVTSIAQLDGAIIRVEKGTTHERNLNDSLPGRTAFSILWSQVTSAVNTLYQDLKEHYANEEVVMFLCTEFGRLVQENGGEAQSP